MGQKYTLETIRQAFKQIAGLPDKELDLARAAFLISRLEYPNLDEDYYLDRLAGISQRLRGRIKNESSADAIIKKMDHLFHQEEGFRGSQENYFDLRNCYLNQVIDRKQGIPVSLSLIYMLVGWGAGVELKGIGLPGHFVVGLYHHNQMTIIDVFNQGAVLEEADCRELVLKMFDGKKTFDAVLLAPLSSKEVLIRLLRNLKGLYRHYDDQLMAFQMIQWILQLNPHAARELKERALIYQQIGDNAKAVRDLEMLLQIKPEAKRREEIPQLLEDLKKNTNLVH